MFFSQVVGQDAAIGDIRMMLQHKRMPHALMILGHNGYGGMALALALVQYIQCESPSELDSCGTCVSCLQMQKIEHPDVNYSFPTIKQKDKKENLSEHFITEFKEFVTQQPYATILDWFKYINVANKQGNISASECRRIIEQLSLKSYQGGNKVRVVWMPEFLGKEGNVLLKLIEEPTPNTYLIFVAEDSKRILQTINSRVQSVRLKPIQPVYIQTQLQEAHGLEEQMAKQIAMASKGSYAQALSLIDDWDNVQLEYVTNWLNALYSNDGIKINGWVETVAKMGRVQINNLLKYIQDLFSTSMRVQFVPDFPLQLADSDVNFVKKLSNLQLSQDTYIEIDANLAKAIYHITRNANIKVQLFHLSIKMQYCIKNMSLKMHY